MTRYIHGDIAGCLFSEQDSYSPERFGVSGFESPYVRFCFTKKEHYDLVKKELEKIKNELTLPILEYLEKTFFDVKLSVKGVAEGLKISESEARNLIRTYGDYLLGLKILACLDKRGYCYFYIDKF